MYSQTGNKWLSFIRETKYFLFPAKFPCLGENKASTEHDKSLLCTT